MKRKYLPQKEKKNMKYSAICPCCQELRHRTELTELSKTLKKYKNHIYIAHLIDDNGYVNTSSLEYFKWACDDCLSIGKAIEANIAKQTNRATEFHAAYFDEEKICASCEKPFDFIKGEKRYWYEELKFRVEAERIHCKPCSNRIRKERILNTRLSNLLKRVDELTKLEVEEVSEIYKKMGKVEKMKQYQSIAFKMKK